MSLNNDKVFKWRSLRELPSPGYGIHLRQDIDGIREHGSGFQGLPFQKKMATSEKDQAVLQSIFNPLLPLGDIPPKHEIENENEINVENTEESKRAKDLETSGVEKAEQGDLEGALECFNEACEICPSRPSCFNNRAQLWRLKGSYLEVVLVF